MKSASHYIVFFAFGVAIFLAWSAAIATLEFVRISAFSSLVLLYGMLLGLPVMAHGRYGSITISRIMIMSLFLLVPLGQFPALYYLGRGVYLIHDQFKRRARAPLPRAEPLTDSAPTTAPVKTPTPTNPNIPRPI